VFTQHICTTSTCIVYEHHGNHLLCSRASSNPTSLQVRKAQHLHLARPPSYFPRKRKNATQLPNNYNCKHMSKLYLTSDQQTPRETRCKHPRCLLQLSHSSDFSRVVLKFHSTLPFCACSALQSSVLSRRGIASQHAADYEVCAYSTTFCKFYEGWRGQ
jgi:hypothetical protein